MLPIGIVTSRVERGCRGTRSVQATAGRIAPTMPSVLVNARYNAQLGIVLASRGPDRFYSDAQCARPWRVSRRPLLASRQAGVRSRARADLHHPAHCAKTPHEVSALATSSGASMPVVRDFSLPRAARASFSLKIVTRLSRHLHRDRRTEFLFGTDVAERYAGARFCAAVHPKNPLWRMLTFVRGVRRAAKMFRVFLSKRLSTALIDRSRP